MCVSIVLHAKFDTDHQTWWVLEHSKVQNLVRYHVVRFVHDRSDYTTYNDLGEIWQGRVHHGYTAARQIWH